MIRCGLEYRAMRQLTIASACLLLVSVNGCTKPSPTANAERPSVTDVESPIHPGARPSVMFDIKSAGVLPGSSGFRIYDCTYQSGGKTARFRLQFKQNGPMSGDSFPVASAEGKFVAVAESDSSVLLEDLKKAPAAGSHSWYRAE